MHSTGPGVEGPPDPQPYINITYVPMTPGRIPICIVCGEYGSSKKDILAHITRKHWLQSRRFGLGMEISLLGE